MRGIGIVTVGVVVRREDEGGGHFLCWISSCFLVQSVGTRADMIWHGAGIALLSFLILLFGYSLEWDLAKGMAAERSICAYVGAGSP